MTQVSDVPPGPLVFFVFIENTAAINNSVSLKWNKLLFPVVSYKVQQTNDGGSTGTGENQRYVFCTCARCVYRYSAIGKSRNFTCTNWIVLHLFSSGCQGDKDTISVPFEWLTTVKCHLCKALPEFQGSTKMVVGIQYDIRLMSETIGNGWKKLKNHEEENKRYLKVCDSKVWSRNVFSILIYTFLYVELHVSSCEIIEMLM
jgi:hypothetical protein